MNPFQNLKQADKAAKQLGLVRAKGRYNGCAHWVRPGSDAIITMVRLAELAGY